MFQFIRRIPKYYKSLDTLPYYCYEKVNEKKDLRYLLILDSYDELPDINGKTHDILADMWERLNDDAIDIFSDNKDLQYYAILKRNYYKIFSEYYSSNKQNSFLKRKLTDAQKELKDYEGRQSGNMTLYQRLQALEAYFKKDIDPMKTSTAKVLNYLNTYSNNVKNTK